MDQKDTDRKKKKRNSHCLYNAVLKHSVIVFYRITLIVYTHTHTQKNIKFMKVGRTTVWIIALVSGFCTGPVHYRSSNNIYKMRESFLWHSFKYFYILCSISLIQNGELASHSRSQFSTSLSLKEKFKSLLLQLHRR